MGCGFIQEFLLGRGGGGRGGSVPLRNPLYLQICGLQKFCFNYRSMNLQIIANNDETSNFQ